MNAAIEWMLTFLVGAVVFAVWVLVIAMARMLYKILFKD